MPRKSTDISDEYLQPYCTKIMQDLSGRPIYMLDLWAFEYDEKSGMPGKTKSPGVNVASLILTTEHLSRIAETIAMAQGWMKTPPDWMKGKSLPADTEPEKEV